MRLKDQQSLDAYQAHPAHVEVLKVMRQHVDNVIAGSLYKCVGVVCGGVRERRSGGSLSCAIVNHTERLNSAQGGTTTPPHLS